MANDEHIRKLRRVTAASASEQVRLSADSWLKNAGGLRRLAETLQVTAREVERGFSDGVDGDPHGTAAQGSAAFLVLRQNVIVRRDQMDRAGVVLTTASDRLADAEKARDGLPEDPGEAPQEPSPYGARDDEEAARQQGEYRKARARHADRTAAYADADQHAQARLADLDASYAEAARTLAEIHATPVRPEDLEVVVEKEVPLDPSPRGGGAVAAGAVLGAGLVGAGLVGAGRSLRGLTPGSVGSPVRAIGATTRAGSSPTLGRSASGPAGAGGGRGGGALGAGAPVGHGGRGGRKRDEARMGDRDLHDDGADWIDDTGAGPGVLA